VINEVEGEFVNLDNMTTDELVAKSAAAQIKRQNIKAREDRVKALTERQKEARRKALHEWAAKPPVRKIRTGEYDRSFTITRTTGEWPPEIPTWRYKFGQWLIKVTHQ